jgi:2-polyprenyl-6-methoxyphenol hydroxylase-like FAD-dependent oxidoreductase
VAGLMHGLVLKALGQNVLVLESRQPSELKAQAAGLSLGPHAYELMKTLVGGNDVYGLHNPASQILDKGSNVVVELPISTAVMTSSWSVVFDRLKSKFEMDEELKGSGIYETGKRVIGTDDTGTSVSVHYREGDSGSEKTVTAKLVVAADGCRSSIRQQFVPEVQTKYAGYLAWRGCVAETETPEALKGAFEGKLVMHMPGGSYILA